jgi:hypothetical protein
MFCKYEKNSRPRGEQQDHEAGQVASEPLVARLLGDHAHVLTRRGYEDRPDDERREEYV